MKTIFKTTVFFVLCMIISVITFGQENKEYSDEIKGVNVSPPTFAGIMVEPQEELGSINEYLVNHIEYPELAQQWAREGIEVVHFVVTTTGEVSDFHVINSVSPEIDQEMIRVLKTTNNMWKPATHNGVPVSQEQEISIAFMVDVPNGNDNTAEIYNHAKHFFAKGNNRLFTMRNSKTALKYYNRAICYLPNDKVILATRGLCKYELGDKPGACQDWNKIKSLGGIESNVYLKNFCEMEGYAEMLNILQEKK